ncbi:hypothetical protein MFMK1_001214 [Metallumcola ferriviriculae]|uniref:Uncharacterized protein n=1 Tax=Metallumcola ferriviriculae TaxID=3039180 RepID=A0AAU0UMG9_9FIRM|nr:hypothetical protein MFMK1_001214 [Desulfitibacteraceae bacterium MK1]
MKLLELMDLFPKIVAINYNPDALEKDIKKVLMYGEETETGSVIFLEAGRLPYSGENLSFDDVVAIAVYCREKSVIDGQILAALLAANVQLLMLPSEVNFNVLSSIVKGQYAGQDFAAQKEEWWYDELLAY